MSSAAPAIPAIEKRSVADIATDRLINAIAAGELPPGARIVEAEIAERMGVSRVPVRESIQRLAIQGILVQAGGRGLCVAPFDDSHIRELYALRVSLETLMLTEALRRFREPALLAELDSCIHRLECAAAQNDLCTLNHADIEFHRVAIAASGNRLGQRVWEGISRHVQIVFGMELFRDPDVQAVVEQHRSLRATLASGDRDRLVEEIRDHICGYRALKLSEQDPGGDDDPPEGPDRQNPGKRRL